MFVVVVCWKRRNKCHWKSQNIAKIINRFLLINYINELKIDSETEETILSLGTIIKIIHINSL